jgi:ABC-2 type transport system ATP-binding protein
MLRIDQISKKFSARQALYPLSLEVASGEIFGMLGHNGAGKSTTFGISLGHVRPDTGEVFISGFSVQKNRARALGRVGAIFESPAFYNYLSGWRNLEMLVALTSRPDPARMRQVIELVGLTNRINDPVSVYSHGMRQRLALAQALLPDPEFIILDEPSEGLDPEGIEEMRHLILRLREEHGLTVLLSSHLLSEVEQICDRVAILNQGQMIYCGAWKDEMNAAPRFRFELDDWPGAQGVFSNAGCGMVDELEPVVVLPAGVDISDLVAALVHAGVRVRRVEPLQWSLEDFYLTRIRS